MPDLELRVTTRAASNHVGPFRDGVLHLRVTRPPADGEANRSVLRLVARALGVAPTRIELVAGERGRRKRVRLADIDPAELARRLAAFASD